MLATYYVPVSAAHVSLMDKFVGNRNLDPCQLFHNLLKMVEVLLLF